MFIRLKSTLILKNISFIFLLFFTLIFTATQSKKDDNIDFYKLLDRTFNEGRNIDYIGINFIRSCNNEIVFSVERLLFNDEIPIYKVYEYRGFPVLYISDATSKENDYAIKILDKLLKSNEIEIEKLLRFKKKNQDVVYGEFAYFKNEKFLINNRELALYWEHCK